MWWVAAAIGPITAAAARQHGFDVVACPAHYTIEALTAAVVEYFSKTSQVLSR